MSDRTESSRQATHAKQEGVDDNVAALSGPVVDAAAIADPKGDDFTVAPPASANEVRPAPPPGATWSSAVNAAPAPAPALGAKPRGESPARWMAAAGIGSAALVAALLYANRGKRDAKARVEPTGRNDPRPGTRNDD